MTGEDVVREARALLGAKWRHQGRRPDGVDCIGLVVLVRQALRLETIDVNDYQRIATDESMLTYCREHMQQIPFTKLKPGDIVVFAFDNQRHMAIIGDYPGGRRFSIIHAYASRRMVVENQFDQFWTPRVRGFFRFPELAV